MESNTPSIRMVGDIGEWSKSYDGLENNVYDGIQNLESTIFDNVGGSHGPVHQYNRMTLRSSRKSKDNLAEAKSLNSRESRSQNQLAMSTSEILGNNIKGLEKAVSPVCQIKVWATVVASGALNLKNYKKWLKAIEPELKSTRATTSSGAV